MWLNSGKRPRKWPPSWGFMPKGLSAWRKCFAPRPQGEWGRGAEAQRRTTGGRKHGFARENDYLRQQRDILKKKLWASSPNPDPRFQRINAMENRASDPFALRSLEVSASGYYDWSNRQAQPGPRAQENARLAQKIVQIHQTAARPMAARASKGIAQRWLRSWSPSHCPFNAPARLCGRAKSASASAHRQQPRPTHRPQPPAGPAGAQRPQSIWLGDITYVATDEGWLYLAGILDLYSRRLIAGP